MPFCVLRRRFYPGTGPWFQALYIMSRNVAMNFARSAAPNLTSIARVASSGI
jgi:hypothetical protein